MINISTSKKENSKENDQNLSNSNIQEKSISGSLISDTSPVYLFCTSKNGINSKNENGWTPIYRSIIANNLIALNELLNLGSDPNISNNLGETPLYLCVDIDNYDALIILLQYNADTNIAKRNGTTPLHLATKKNKDNFMHALLRNKANPNLPNKLYSQTPTHLAIINKINEEMLNIFHEYNADIYNIKDKYEKTPFDYAKDLKDEEYLNMVVNIFGDKNNEIKPKLSKTINVNIQNKKDDIIIPQNLHFHNSNYNLIPEKITIENEEKQNIIETKEEDYKLDENKLGKKEENDNINIIEIKNDDDKRNDIDNNNNNIIESNKKSENNGFINFDNLYSDRSIFQNSDNSKSKKQNPSSDNKSNKKNNNINDNNLSEFKPVISVTEQNEIKQKNSLIKTFKSKINIDTKMIDNSKDIVFLNHNDNNYTNNINLIKDQIKKEEIEINNDINDNENYNENENENENNIIGVNESNDEGKRKSDNMDKEIIKNIISSTVKKIKVNSNTYISDYSSLNNNSMAKNNVNSNSKIEDLKLFSNSNKSNTNNEIKQSDNTNLENDITTNNQLENGTSSFILYNSKKHVVQNDTTNNNINNDNDNDIESNNNLNNSISTNNKISDITPISTKKLNNDITPTVNSNIFSEMQLNSLNSNQNKYATQADLDISNKDIKVQTEEKISRSNKKESNSNTKEINENKLNNDIHIISNSDHNLYDGSLEYSKSKSNIAINNQNLSIQSKNNSLNSPNLNNTNSTNNNVNLQLNQHHRQISYHKNSNSSVNKRRKEEEAQIEDSYNNNSSSNNKENDTPNNKEIIYYTKNYLKGNDNISSKKDNQFKNPKSEVVHNNIVRDHNLSEANINNNNMNIQRYNSLTNKTNSINQKIFTYTSPNVNKNTYIIETNMNNNADAKTNPNVNLSNLNGTKEEFFSNNNNLSSFLNTNKKEEQNNKDNSSLRESKNNDNSTFNVYDDVMEVKNLGKKTNIYTTNNQNTINNTNNKKKTDNKMRTYRGSSIGNTTLASLTKNINNTGKQSINSAMAKSITNNNYNTNSTNIILTARNSNTNNSDNIIKNIPINTLLRLRDWLISCDLLCYYNLLIENNMYDIDKCISDLQNNKINISYKDIEDIGIRKPGHIFRLLLKLEIDSGILDNNLFNYILSKFNMSSSISNNIILTSSITDINCCGICNKNKNYQSYIKRNDCAYNDIFTFLKYKDLWKYKENFLHNGFDQLEYVLLQLFSKYTYDKEIMNDCFHIYIDKDKKNVLNKLYEEKRCIALEVGMETDDNEINQVLSNYSYSSKYSNKKNNHNSEQKNSGEENCCNIF